MERIKGCEKNSLIIHSNMYNRLLKIWNSEYEKILGILATKAPVLYIGVLINNSSDHSLFFYIATKVLCIIITAVTGDEMCPVTCTESMV